MVSHYLYSHTISYIYPVKEKMKVLKDHRVGKFGENRVAFTANYYYL